MAMGTTPKPQVTYADVEVFINRIRPAIQADGGDIELVDVKDNTVFVRLYGACVGCPMAVLTLQMGIERMIREEYPEIKGVVAV